MSITVIKQISYSSFYYTLSSVLTGTITSTYTDFFGAGQTSDSRAMIFSTVSSFQCISGSFSCSTAMTFTTITGSFASTVYSHALNSYGVRTQSALATTTSFTLKAQWYSCLKSTQSLVSSNSLEYDLISSISKGTSYTWSYLDPQNYCSDYTTSLYSTNFKYVLDVSLNTTAYSSELNYQI